MTASPFHRGVRNGSSSAVALLAIVTLTCSAPIGCAGDHVSTARPAAPAAATPGADHFAPVRVRIHPLTRFVRAGSSDAEPRIETHIELLDRWGLPVRALGELNIRLTPGEEATRRIREREPDFTGALAWTIDMTDPEDNATRYFDRVTRTYRISLGDPALRDVAAAPFALDVSFASPRGVALPASTVIRPPLPDERPDEPLPE